MLWRLAENDLPNEMKEVLLYDKDKGVAVGYYFKGAACFFRSYDGLRLLKVICWMPIPEMDKLAI